MGVRASAAAVLAYAGIAIVDVALSAAVAGWHKFYVDCAVRQLVGSLSLVALGAMVLVPATRGAAEEGARRAARSLSGVAIAAWCFTLVELDRVTRFMNGDFGSAFDERLHQRDALFETAVNVELLAQLAVIGALVSQAVSYAQVATSRKDPSLAQRASRLARLIALLASPSVASFLLLNSGDIDAALFAASSARSAVVQGAIVLAIVAVARLYASVSRGVATGFGAGAGHVEGVRSG
jgi:hypothetical protein